MPTYKCDICGKTTCRIVVEDGHEVEPEYTDECLQEYGSYTAYFELEEQ